MKTVGIICEYNPFHNGHALQFQKIRAKLGMDTAIVCLMSGDFVQRGAPAVFDKTLRAKAAVQCGADLVLELPASAALSSAEGFAAGGVRILDGLCDTLCFGAEQADSALLWRLAEALLRPDFSELLRQELASGCSFPAARQKALQALGMPASLVETPNNILAVEYCKAILAGNHKMDILPVVREGAYHDTVPDPSFPSATAVRALLEEKKDCTPYLPKAAAAHFRDAAVHTRQAGERAMLARLRTMTDEEFEVLPYGAEGLWRKLMHNCRKQPDLESILTATKSKRYTRSRLDRMVMCAFLGLTRADLETDIPYVRVLGFNDIGRALLKNCSGTIPLVNAGEKVPGEYGQQELRIGSLYGLFAQDHPDPPNEESQRRIFYERGLRSLDETL